MGKWGKGDKVVPIRRARWRGRPVRRQPDLLRFWPEARPQPLWKRYAPLWLGAVLAGLAYGVYLTPSAPAAPSAAIEWNAVQAVPKGIEDASDRAWRERAKIPGTPQMDASERGAEAAAAPGGGAPRAFGLCHSGGGMNCVVDGDTIWLAGQNIRIADIDTPETHEPRCAAEQALGDRATRRLHQLVNSGTVTLTPIDRDADGYGRKLRIVNGRHQRRRHAGQRRPGAMVRRRQEGVVRLRRRAQGSDCEAIGSQCVEPPKARPTCRSADRIDGAALPRPKTLSARRGARRLSN